METLEQLGEFVKCGEFVRFGLHLPRQALISCGTLILILEKGDLFE